MRTGKCTPLTKPHETVLRPKSRCYTPRPIEPTGIGAGSGRSRDRRCRLVRRTSPRVSSPSSCRPSCRRLRSPPEWKDQQRLWGHAFHPMCSYLASFPAALTHAFIARYSRPGDVVLDPFTGRGTTPLQACAEGRIGVGNDLNPFAHLLTAAKVEPATAPRPRRVSPRSGSAWNASRRLARAGRRPSRPRRTPRTPACRRPGPGSSPADGGERVPAEVALAFHPRTLGQLLFVRTALRLDDRTDRFLAAALTGILHGKSASYLSALMPNTFCMAPRYVRDFAARTGFASPRARRLRRPGREARPALPPAAAADRGDRAARRRPRRRRRGPGRPCAGAAGRSAPGSS